MSDAPVTQRPGRIRPARMGDVRPIHALLAGFAAKGLMLPRSISSLYDHLRDFVVYEEAGEILGITGLLGSGRTELALSLFGMNPPDSGTIRLDGKPLALATNRQWLPQFSR